MDWFTKNIVLRIELEGIEVKDQGEFFSMPLNCYTGYSTLCDIDKPIAGKVILTCPPGFEAWIGGVSLSIDETVYFMDIFTSVEIAKIEVQIGEPTTINTGVEYVFSLKIDQSGDRFKTKWHDTYNGETFGLQHTLICSLIRPWYTLFNDPVFKQLRLFQMDNNRLSAEDKFALHRIEIFEIAKLCEVTMPSQWIQPGHPVFLNLEIEELVKPIDYAQFTLFKSEFIEEQSTDIVLGVFKICGPDNIIEGANEEEESIGPKSTMTISKRIDEGDAEPRHSDGIKRGTSMEMQITLSPSLCASFDTCPKGLQSSYEENPSEVSAQHKDGVALRYYLRCIMIDCDGDSFWNTVEVFVYRTERPDHLEIKPSASVESPATRRVSISSVV
jgi:hypothetical protein